MTKEPSKRALREAAYREAQPPRVLPASWWEPKVAERMSEWIKMMKRIGS